MNNEPKDKSYFCAATDAYQIAREGHPPIAEHPCFDLAEDFPSLAEYAAGKRFPTWEELEARRKAKP